MRPLVGNQEVDALSFLCRRSAAGTRGLEILTQRHKEIPRHMFEVAVPAVIGGEIIGWENFRALSERVTVKCCGGRHHA